MRFSGLFLVCAACAAAPARTPGAPSSAESSTLLSDALGPAALAVLEPRSGSTVAGTAQFTAASSGGLKAHLEVSGAAPGRHGVHIHEKGDCSDPEAKSAGGHYNPNTGPHHGGPHTAARHGGDLGNLEVDASGKGSLDVVVEGLSVASLQDGVVGRALVVHERADDLATDPAGNSGARVACGRIQAPPIGH